MPYQLTDAHTTADIGLIISGNDLEELFSEAAMGLTEIMVDLDGLEERKEISFELEDENLEGLFFNWLSEIIYYKDAECFLIKQCNVEISGDRNNRLKATLSGDIIDPERHALKADVKALTYYKYRIEKIGDNWQGEVVFDL